MEKTYSENTTLIIARRKIFSSLSKVEQVNINDAITLTNGEFLPIQKMIEGEYSVYGGGGDTLKTHNNFIVIKETLGIGRVGARCGCVFKIKPKSWVTDNDLYAIRIDTQFDLHFLIHFLNFKNINQFANTAAQPVISQKRISSITIPKIDKNVQQEIVEILNSIENGSTQFDNDKYNLNQVLKSISSKNSVDLEFTHQLEFLKKLRQQILQDAVQGKLLNSSPPHEGEYPQGEGVLNYKSISNLPALKSFRTVLRSHLTPAEATLWTLLSDRKLQGRKFRRQHSVGNYILDFFCPEEKLAVELDGEVHMNTIAERYDRERDIFLQYTGIKVLRFENRMVFDLPESLLREIEENFGWDNKITTPAFGHPSLEGGEREQMEDARVLLEKIRVEKQQLIAQGKIKKEKPLPEIKPEEIPFEIPDNWVWCRIGELAQHNSGKTLDSGRNSGKPRKCITTSNLYWGYFETENLKTILIEDGELTRCTAKKGDLLICEGGDAGRAAIWDLDSEICFQNHIHRVRFFGNISSTYVYWYFLYLSMSGGIDTYRKGMGISNLSGKSLSLIILPLPSIPEQHSIVTKIEELMKLCDELEQSIQHNQKYTQELLKVALKEALEPVQINPYSMA